jgi:hypothetical protein
MDILINQVIHFESYYVSGITLAFGNTGMEHGFPLRTWLQNWIWKGSSGKRKRNEVQDSGHAQFISQPPRCSRSHSLALLWWPAGQGVDSLTLVMPLREEVMIFTVSIVTLWTIFSSKSLQ